ncbi:LysM peptidoglycan-binding domain-containing protein [Parachryseolinea silvisoli]|uniref:LysM peptidoglycan-binding domain-containing protein n=1 Tax=Parachryseolinea silvisoli TaxID=2873601 RepID=UPI002265A5CE|nr:LysM peptidoglycan-binding domain-containing protein [Parachryseolinea silvisoli]MCD9019999.1 LysM peptidoglycan-binding domain-containing protein [Parachryseolinea silvisoli]
MINVLIYAGALFFQPQAYDSLGIETVNGKIFVVHRVEEKETLYGISKRYGTTVDAIVQYNPDAASGLGTGQILKVPYTKPTTNRATTVTTTPATGRGGVIHVVAARETMFSISKAYGVTVDELKQWNNLTDNALSPGQELVIKRRNTTTGTTPSENVTTVAPTASGKGVHTVEAKETLFSIATKHGISVQQLKDWNHLTNNEISIGQTLAVKQPSGQTTPAEEPRTPPSYTSTTPTTNTTTPTPTPVKHDPPAVTETPREKTEPVAVKQQPVEPKTTTIRVYDGVKNSDEVMESGLAELIEGTEGNRKYLALHRTAPVGTILKIKNEMNNREVFVRVMGKLPDTAMTDKLIIKISKSAYDRLGAIDARFRVEVTYYK